MRLNEKDCDLQLFQQHAYNLSSAGLLQAGRPASQTPVSFFV
jgi:hypothetical protein